MIKRFLGLADLARERDRIGFNPDSFAHRVFEYAKEAGPDAPPHNYFTEQRQYMILATALEMSLLGVCFDRSELIDISFCAFPRRF